MKYIKYYKENIEKKYHSIDYGEYIGKTYGPTEYFTEREYDSIKKCTSHNGIFSSSRDLIYINFIRNNKIHVEFYICKLPDEWYVIREEINLKHTLSKKGIEEKNSCYLCDQFDGLIQCLNDMTSKIYREHKHLLHL